MSGPLIVIPCLNEAAHLPALLDQLIAESPADALIVVADGGSTDGTPAIAERAAAAHPNVRLLHNGKRIQSAAVNLAAVRFGADREWLVRVDAHCGYPADYVAGLLAAAARTGADAVVVPMITQAEPGRCFQAAAAAAQNSKLGAGGSAHREAGGEGRFIEHGHHALMRLSTFMTAGGYDEGFSHNEDAELDTRTARAGARLWLEPSLALIYHPRAAPGPLWRQYLKYGEGRARTVQRHRARLKLRQAAPLAVAPAAALAGTGVVLAPVTHGLALILALPAAAWAGLCLAFGLALAARARSACVAASGGAAMVMHLAWSAGFLRQTLLSQAPGPEPAPLVADPVV